MNAKANVVSNLNQSSKVLRNSSGRLLYIDAIRGVAFLGMVVHHFVFFMYWQEIAIISPWSLPVEMIGWLVRVTFVLLVGVSSWLWFQKYWNGDIPKLLTTTVKRAAKVGLAAVLVTFFTVFFIPELPVYFGVLHMITYSIVFVVPFLFIPKVAWLVGLFLIFLARLHALVEYDLGIYWLVKSSVRTPALDYFPVLPWFGVVLIGVSVGYYIHSKDAFFGWKFKRDIGSETVTTILSWLGRNALVLYVMHFPIVWFITYGLRLVLS